MIERRRYSKTCLYCNNLFSTTHKEARFCSKSCAVRSRSVLDINIWENGFSHLNVYILGLISSDGCIYYSKRHKRDLLNITLKDYEMIKTLNHLMTPTKKIYKNQGCYCVIYKNDNAINFIKSLGISYRKSLTLNFPKIPKEYLWDFIRGYFDGDGCIYKSHNNGHDYMFISLTSASISILNTLKNILLEFDIHARINKDCRKDTYYLRISRQKDVKKFGEYMYKDANLFLSRKRERFNIFLGTLRLPYKFYKDVLYPILKNIEISCFKKETPHLVWMSG